MHMVDNGKTDEKIIAVCVSDPFFKDYESINDLPKHVTEEIKHFFTVYKTLEGKETIVGNDLDDTEAAKVIISDSIKRYKDKFEY